MGTIIKTIVKFIFAIIILLFWVNPDYSQVAINTNGADPDPSAMLDITSTTKGFLMPRMLESDRTSISSPATGLMVYQTDGTAGFWYYDGATWVSFAGGSCEWTDAGTSIYPNEIADNVGIGTSNPAALLSVGDGSLFQVNSSGYALGITGTAAAPSFSFMTDDNNGMYLGGTDILRFSTAGSDRLSIIANGNVGVGTTTPAALFSVGNGSLFQIKSDGVALGIAGTAGAPSFSFVSDPDNGFYSGGADILRFSTAGSDRLSIIANGNVGIGSATPGYLLDVNGAIRAGCPGTTGQLRIYSDQATDYDIIFNPSASQTQNTTYTLPPNDGDASQILTSTDANGTLSWATGGSSAPTYYELMQVITPAASATWTNVALSAYGVVAGDLVQVAVSNNATGSEYDAGARTDGSGLSRLFSLVEAESGGSSWVTFQVVAVGATAIIELYEESDANQTSYLIGYWH